VYRVLVLRQVVSMMILCSHELLAVLRSLCYVALDCDMCVVEVCG